MSNSGNRRRRSLPVNQCDSSGEGVASKCL